MTEKNDSINHPAHYESASVGIEPIDVCEHFDFCHGNALKYICRYRYKGKPNEDLHKALWYLDRGYPEDDKATSVIKGNDLVRHYLLHSENPILKAVVHRTGSYWFNLQQEIQKALKEEA